MEKIQIVIAAVLLALPAHAPLMISAGSNEAFVGALGNTLCVDNIRLEYDH